MRLTQKIVRQPRHHLRELNWKNNWLTPKNGIKHLAAPIGSTPTAIKT